jgi:mannosyltransferase OCH1-like enzyme
MIIAVHIGVRFAGHDLIADFLAHNHVGLAKKGWAVPQPGASESEVPLEEIANLWCSWLDSLASSEGCAPSQVLLSESRLTDELLIHGQAGQAVNAFRSRGSVTGIASVRRIDDYIAASYVDQLRAGRSTPLRRPELNGTGIKYNYYSRLQKWLQALGQDLTTVFCPAEGPSEQLVAAILRTLDILDLAGLTHSDVPLEPPLSVDAADAMRRFNGALLKSELAAARVLDARDGAYQSLAKTSQGEPPFRMPEEAATYLVHRFRNVAQDVAAHMSQEDAERFLSREVPTAGEADRSRVQSLCRALTDELDLPGLSFRGPRQAVSDRRLLRRKVAQAREAMASGDEETYERCLTQVRRRLSAVPEFIAQHGAGTKDHQIPRRIVQYWEPWPPPQEMLPWMDSWDVIGLPGEEHQLISYEQGLDVVTSVAGTRGGEAFTQAPHPAARADLFRYAELFLRGGWYVDAEHEALLPIPGVFEWPVEHVFVRRPGSGLVTNSFIGAAPGSTLLREVLEEACTNVIERPRTTILEMTGPVMFTSFVLDYVARPAASFVMMPTTAVFHGVLQLVHNEAENKVRSHWRSHSLVP